MEMPLDGAKYGRLLNLQTLLITKHFLSGILYFGLLCAGQDFHTLFPEVNDYCKSVNKTNHHKAYEKKKQKDWNNFLKFLPEGKGIYFTHSDLTSYFDKLKYEHMYTGSTLTHVLNGIKHGYKVESGRTLNSAFPSIGDYVKSLQ